MHAHRAPISLVWGLSAGECQIGADPISSGRCVDLDRAPHLLLGQLTSVIRPRAITTRRTGRWSWPQADTGLVRAEGEIDGHSRRDRAVANTGAPMKVTARRPHGRAAHVRPLLAATLTAALALTGCGPAGDDDDNVEPPEMPLVPTSPIGGLDRVWEAGQFLVKIHPSTTTDRRNEIHAAADAVSVSGFGNLHGMSVVRVGESADLMEVAAAYESFDEVEYVALDHRFEAAEVAAPDEEFWGYLWGLDNDGQDDGIAGIDIGVREAWEVTAGARAVVGVLDSGVRTTHFDLAETVWTNQAEANGVPGVDDDNNGYVDDIHGVDLSIDGGGPLIAYDDHGTHVAGTIAGALNGGGAVGVAPSARVAGCAASSGPGTGMLSTVAIVRCIDYFLTLKERGVNLVAVNMSFGGPAEVPAIREGIAALGEAGVLAIAAAGNGGEDGIGDDNDLLPSFPASYDLPNVIAVGAHDRAGDTALFSNFGAHSVDVFAPGVDILSATADSDFSLSFFPGTSMAAPQVAGVAALLASQNGNYTAAQIRNRIIAGAADFADPEVVGGRLVAAEDNTGKGALTCNDQMVRRRVFPTADEVTVRAGGRLVVRILAIECGQRSFAPRVRRSNGAIATLLDEGTGVDQWANDGIFSGRLVFPNVGEQVLSFPGGDEVTVHVIPAFSWHNSRVPEDVNDDGFISPVDALIIIRALNTAGGGALPEGPDDRYSHFIDVNNDGFVSPLDALIVIRYLNDEGAGPASAMAHVERPWTAHGDPADSTNLAYDYAMGYHFTALEDGDITQLGGSFAGTKRVVLFDRDTARSSASRSWRAVASPRSSPSPSAADSA